MSEQQEPQAAGGVIESGNFAIGCTGVGPEFLTVPKGGQSLLAGLADAARKMKAETEALRLKELRAVVREEVQRALYPSPTEGVYDVREYRRIEERDSDGTLWRGMLYRVKENAI